MKYDSSMTQFRSDIIAALQHMLSNDSEITKEFRSDDSSPAPLREHLKSEYKSYGGYSGGGLDYTHRASGIEIKFDDPLNNDGDKTLTLTWSQTAKFIRDNWNEIFNKSGSEEDKPSEQISYIDMLRKRYPKVNETDEWFDTAYCPSDLFDGDGVNDPGDDKCDYTVKDKEACQKCWRSLCAANATDAHYGYFEEEYFEHYPAEDTTEADAVPEISEEKSAADNPSENQTVNGSIINIPVGAIEPHPDNPRKNVGDVSELAESIKKNGIMQNLMVIPCENGYRCLIGHRRLAAAKLVGLKTVPCVIAQDIPLIDQIGKMLSENIQRSDLTKLEQIDGMQMMLDLGDTADGISEKTGLSESTVRRRLKLLEYGREKIGQAFERGATFSDFEKLNGISDPKVREKLAESIGTSNFNYAYENACRDEKSAKAYADALELIKSFAAEIPKDEKEDYKYMDTVNSYYAKDFKKPDDTENIKYFYVIYSFCVEIYRELTADEIKTREQTKKENEAAEKKREQRREAILELDKLTDIAAELRHRFILGFDPLKGCNTQKDQLALYKKLCGFMVRAYIEFGVEGCDTFDTFLNNIEFNTTEEFEEMDTEEQSAAVEKYIYKLHNGEIKAMFAMLISMVGSDKFSAYYNRYDGGKHMPCPELDFTYEVLCAFGYEMSDVEKQLQDGTHELFKEEHQ